MARREGGERQRERAVPALAKEKELAGIARSEVQCRSGPCSPATAGEMLGSESRDVAPRLHRARVRAFFLQLFAQCDTEASRFWSFCLLSLLQLLAGVVVSMLAAPYLLDDGNDVLMKEEVDGGWMLDACWVCSFNRILRCATL